MDCRSGKTHFYEAGQLVEAGEARGSDRQTDRQTDRKTIDRLPFQQLLVQEKVKQLVFIMPRGRKRKNQVFVPQPWIPNSSSEGEQEDVGPDDVVVVVRDDAPEDVVVQDLVPDDIVVQDLAPDGAGDDDIRELMEQSRYDHVIGNLKKKTHIFKKICFISLFLNIIKSI